MPEFFHVGDSTPEEMIMSSRLKPAMSYTERVRQGSMSIPEAQYHQSGLNCARLLKNAFERYELKYKTLRNGCRMLRAYTKGRGGRECEKKLDREYALLKDARDQALIDATLCRHTLDDIERALVDASLL